MQNLYPIELIKSELRAHKAAINEYQDDLSFNLYHIQEGHKPDLSLIKSQPELTLDLRLPLLDFLYKVTKRTKLSVGIFYDAVKLFDRYCSKRVVLKAQAQLVGCTCIWLAAKHEGGCNHIVNSLNKPIANRYLGPTQRSRIPRLIEFVQLCGPACGYDEGMFIQMERHILNTLDWNISQISIYNWCFNIHELQLLNDSVDSDPALFDFKKVFYMKNFILELSLYSSYFIMQDPSNLSSLIKKLLSILILNEENHFNIKKELLQKILDDNKVESCYSTQFNLLNSSSNINDDAYATSNPKNSLVDYSPLSASLCSSSSSADSDEINKLIYSIATVSNTIYQSYTNTEYKEVNEVIAKIHKVAVSHIMALKEEEKELKRQQQEKEQMIQQYHQQQQLYLNVSNSCSLDTQQQHYERSPSVYSSSASSNSDYEDSYSTFSGRKGSYDTTSSSVVSTPLPSPSGISHSSNIHCQKHKQHFVNKLAMNLNFFHQKTV